MFYILTPQIYTTKYLEWGFFVNFVQKIGTFLHPQIFWRQVSATLHKILEKYCDFTLEWETISPPFITLKNNQIFWRQMSATLQDPGKIQWFYWRLRDYFGKPWSCCNEHMGWKPFYEQSQQYISQTYSHEPRPKPCHWAKYDKSFTYIKHKSFRIHNWLRSLQHITGNFCLLHFQARKMHMNT